MDNLTKYQKNTSPITVYAISDKAQSESLKDWYKKKTKPLPPKEFANVMREVNKLSAKDDDERAADEKAALDKKTRLAKINELRSLISMLRQKMYTSGFDPKIASELSETQSKLYWLLTEY